MASTKNSWLILGGIVLGGAALMLVSAKKTPPALPKFHVGDRIEYKVLSPVNVIYQIIGMDATRYNMAQEINGQLMFPDWYGIASIDANYVLTMR